MLPNSPPDSYFVVDSTPFRAAKTQQSGVAELVRYGPRRLYNRFRTERGWGELAIHKAAGQFVQVCFAQRQRLSGYRTLAAFCGRQRSGRSRPRLLAHSCEEFTSASLLEQKALPNDSVRSVVTFRWNYSDPDGAESVVSAFLKVNQGSWTPIDRNQALVSLVLDPSASGNATAELYYGTQNNASLIVDGFCRRPQPDVFEGAGFGGYGKPRGFVQCVLPASKDQRPSSGGAQPTSVRQAYTGLLDELNISYDIEDYHRMQQPMHLNSGIRVSVC